MGPVSAPPLVLASASPRRAELLGRLGYTFEIRAVRVDESVHSGELPGEYVARVAASKADAAWQPGLVVVAADTCVVRDGVALGKPSDRSEAFRMLQSLAGRTHVVLTAVHVIGADGATTAFTSEALVTMAPVDPRVLRGYVAGGEPMGKAGAYAIQGQGAALIRSVDGDPTTVVGLPLRETADALRAVGLPPPAFSS